MTRRLGTLLRGRSYALALLLALGGLAANALLQPSLLRPGVLSGNLLNTLPLVLVAAGQTLVVLGGGVDLSLGALVSLCNVTFVTLLAARASAAEVAWAATAALGLGLVGGLLNGACVALLRLQPIVATFATSFVFAGAALYVMPSPGGSVPQGLVQAYYSSPLGIPNFFWGVAALLLPWWAARRTRYGPYLYAVGGDARAAYVTGVPVALVWLTTYALAGLLAGLGALALTLSTGTGDPLVGGPMTLSSIVAVVLGGTRLRGGSGGLLGTVLGVVVLSTVQNIVAFLGVPSWWQTLINGVIVLLALASARLEVLLRRRGTWAGA